MSKTQRIEATMEIVRTVAGLLIAYGIALIILFAISDDPVFIIQKFILGPFDTPRRIGSVINLAIPFTICGLSMCFMYAVNRFNLVPEGIFMLAACIVTLISIQIGDALPAVVMIPLLMLIAFAVGVIVAFVPAIMERKFNANVVVVSLMLNSILSWLAVWLLQYKMRDPSISYIGSKEIPESARLPRLFAGAKEGLGQSLGKFRIQSGLIIAILCLIVVALLFYKTSYGWKMRLVGENPQFATAVGLSAVSISFSAQLIGGGVAGIAGATEMMGNYTRFQWTATTQHGFDGLLVAVLAKKNPVLVPIGALFLAYIRIGADVVNSSGDIPKEFITVIQGIVILLIAAESFMSGIKNKMIYKAAEKDEAEKKAKQAANA